MRVCEIIACPNFLTVLDFVENSAFESFFRGKDDGPVLADNQNLPSLP